MANQEDQFGDPSVAQINWNPANKKSPSSRRRRRPTTPAHLCVEQITAITSATPVGDLAIADLHAPGIREVHPQRLNGRDTQSAMSTTILSVNRLMVAGGTACSKVVEVRGDLSGS